MSNTIPISAVEMIPLNHIAMNNSSGIGCPKISDTETPTNNVINSVIPKPVKTTVCLTDKSFKNCMNFFTV